MEDLKTLRQQAARKKHLEAVCSSLEAQRGELDRKLQLLDEQRRKEQLDVEKLEGRSLAALFYAAVGKMDEKLDKERREACAAAAKYDAAARELYSVEEELDRARAELEELGDCEARYAQVLAEQTARVRSSGSPAGAAVLELEARIAALDARLREIREAEMAGDSALAAAEQVLSSLDSAEGWSTWDMLGGGLLTDMAKYGHLDSAQRQVEQLQVCLRQFRTELADVEICADLDVRVEGGLQFADYFFDNLFTDWAVRDRIHDSQARAHHVREQIGGTLDRLETMEAETRRERQDLQDRLDALVVETT